VEVELTEARLGTELRAVGLIEVGGVGVRLVVVVEPADVLAREEL
jgi:hypothetical protein